VNLWLLGRFVLWSVISAVFVVACMLLYYLLMHSVPSYGLRQSIVIFAICIFAFGFSKDLQKAKTKGSD
jgi:hypothetical protein